MIISAYGDMKNIRTAMNRGAFDFVTKSIDFEDLQVTIDRTLRHVAEWREALLSRDKLVVLQNELDVARRMQQSILPTQFPRGPGFGVYGKMEAARNVGGDFFDILYLNNGRTPLGSDTNFGVRPQPWTTPTPVRCCGRLANYCMRTMRRECLLPFYTGCTIHPTEN